MPIDRAGSEVSLFTELVECRCKLSMKKVAVCNSILKCFCLHYIAYQASNLLGHNLNLTSFTEVV